MGETMSIRSLNILTILLVVAAGTANAAGPDLKEGKWNVSYQMEVSGMPFQMPPIKSEKTMCLDKDNFIPDNSQPGQDCKISDQKVNGNVVTWTMSCRAQDKVIEGQGKITYKGTHYDGVMNAQLLSTEASGSAVSYKYSMQGQRVGACSK
jgi:hypothetical protein